MHFFLARPGQKIRDPKDCKTLCQVVVTLKLGSRGDYGSLADQPKVF